MSSRAKPVVGIPCDRKMIGKMPFHAAGEKYVDAVRDVAGALPLLIPVTKTPLELEEVLGIVDGVFLTGSLSNVGPELYAGAPPRPGLKLDAARDATALPLINAALDRGVPLFGVCRGLQELNVALGGTLDQHIEEIEGRFDHREDQEAPEEVRYGPAHEVDLEAGGLLARITGERRLKVNSLHSQAIGRLAPGLAVEARAGDGTIEAVSLPSAAGFVLAVQWHPEWRARENPFSRKILEAFGAALRQKMAGQQAAAPGPQLTRIKD